MRLIVLVAVLAAQGRSKELRDAIRWSLDSRVGMDLLRETLLQTMLFAGYPRAIHAFEILAELAAGRQPVAHRMDRVPPRASKEAFFRRRGRELFERIYGADSSQVVARISDFHPEFMDWIFTDAYGKVLARPFLNLRVREILASALLVALDLPRQLTPHLRGALREGVEAEVLRGLLERLRMLLPEARIRMAFERLERAESTL